MDYKFTVRRLSNGKWFVSVEHRDKRASPDAPWQFDHNTDVFNKGQVVASFVAGSRTWIAVSPHYAYRSATDRLYAGTVYALGAPELSEIRD